MAHLTGPGSLTLVAVIRWAATTFAGLFLVTIVEENIRRLAEEKHWDRLLTSGIGAMPDASYFTKSKWFWFAFGLATGVAFALWIGRVFPERKTKKMTPPSLKDTQFLFNSAIEPAYGAIMAVINTMVLALHKHPSVIIQHLAPAIRLGATDLSQSTYGLRRG
jgi:hypothetical protein